MEQWLSAAEQATWRAYLVSSMLLMRELDHQLQRDSGITHTDYAVLVQLSDLGGRTARLTELAGLMDHSQSRMSHAVARLERAGLLRREVDAADRRVVHVVLTDAGSAALEAAAPGHVRAVQELVFEPLTPEQLDTMRTVCEGMLSRIGRSRSDRT